MYNELLQLISNEQWQEAAQKLNSLLEYSFDDILAIIAVNIARAFGNEALEYDFIRNGLIYNCENYELYFLLGNYYEQHNVNQAWLCYENAEFYCNNSDDLALISEYKHNLEIHPAWNVRKCSIVILSYNLLELTKGCLDSIRNTCPRSAYELIIIDNNSQDGAAEWLKSQSDIKLICNTENVGFPRGCNQGIEAAAPETDIFLLNNDTILPPNALFWLRMGLYETDNTGATGSVSNHVANYQIIDKHFNTLSEYIEYAKTNNVPSLNPYEIKMHLIGFALLIKRSALDEIGLLDERFSPGNYEDNDLGLRLVNAGWRVLLCHNSFIYHYGSGNGTNEKKWNPLLQTNLQKIIEKYGFDVRYHNYIRKEIFPMIHHDSSKDIKVLEIGCGFGMTLSRIKYMWPNAIVFGIESDARVAELASKQLNIIHGDISSIHLPYPENYFDYIIFSDVLDALPNQSEVLAKVAVHLNETGQILCSNSTILKT